MQNTTQKFKYDNTAKEERNRSNDVGVYGLSSDSGYFHSQDHSLLFSNRNNEKDDIIGINKAKNSKIVEQTPLDKKASPTDSYTSGNTVNNYRGDKRCVLTQPNDLSSNIYDTNDSVCSSIATGASSGAIRGPRSLMTVSATYEEAVLAAKTRDPSISASLLAAGGRCDDMLFFQIGISEHLRRTRIALEVLRLIICGLTIFMCIAALHTSMFVLKHAVLRGVSPGMAAISEFAAWLYGSQKSRGSVHATTDSKTDANPQMDAFILYIENNIVFTSTVWCYVGFQHPLFSLLGSMLLLVGVTHLKRRSQLLSSAVIVHRLNTEVLEPSFGLRYDLRSGRLLVRVINE